MILTGRTFPISDTDRTKAKYSTIPVDAEALVSTITPFQVYFVA